MVWADSTISTGGAPALTSVTGASLERKRISIYTAISAEGDVFVESEKVTPSYKLKIEPGYDNGKIKAGFAQKVKLKQDRNRGVNTWSLSDLQAYLGPSKRYRLGNGVTMEPRGELWLPISDRSRNKDGLLAGPGASIYLKKYFSIFRLSAVLAYRNFVYSADVSDRLEDFSNYNQLTLKAYLPARFYVTLRAEFINSWNQTGQHYVYLNTRQLVGFRWGKSLAFELAHNYGADYFNGKSTPFRLASADRSKVSGRISYVY